jgi:hypothetical protein
MEAYNGRLELRRQRVLMQHLALGLEISPSW